MGSVIQLKNQVNNSYFQLKNSVEDKLMLVEEKIKSKLVKEMISSMPVEKILWEAPNKNQQVWFINNFGANVNLGNIASNEVISLECLRLGLRGDTFNNFLT